MGCSWNQNTWIQQHCSCNQPSLNTGIQNLVVLKNTNSFGIKKTPMLLRTCFLGGINKTLRYLRKLGRNLVKNKTRFNKEHSTLSGTKAAPSFRQAFQVYPAWETCTKKGNFAICSPPLLSAVWYLLFHHQVKECPWNAAVVWGHQAICNM